MRLGYCRVSTLEQDLSLQKDALRAAGCKELFEDMVSGSKEQRPGLDKLFSYLREGDTLVVWRLDRLGRSLKHLIAIAEDLDAQGVGFASLTEGFDTTTSGGKLIFQIFGAIAEFERNLIRERTLAGQAAARARGRNGGKPKKSATKIKAAIALAGTTNTPIQDICREVGISRATYYGRRKEFE